ncbi:hypothetical protein ACFLV7_03905 [Chloroflexota bacterium]
MSKSVTRIIKIADINITLISERDRGVFEFNDNYNPFFTKETGDFQYQLKYGKLPNLGFWRQVFDSGGTWRLYEKRNQWGIGIYSPIFGPEPYQVGIFESDFSEGVIYLSNSDLNKPYTPFPFAYPISELVMINLLSQGYGLMLHACAVKDGERGLLFAGTSGAGKSTTARLWSEREGVTILSDDRVIIRKQGEQFMIYGTPWHGEARFLSSQSALLSQIYLIDHSDKNQFLSLKPKDAYTRLLVRSFPTYWNSSGMEFTLDFIKQIVNAIPCFEYGFVPDEGAVDFIRCQTSI